MSSSVLLLADLTYAIMQQSRHRLFGSDMGLSVDVLAVKHRLPRALIAEGVRWYHDRFTKRSRYADFVSSTPDT